MASFAGNFIAYSRQKLADHHAQAARCARLLTQSEVWHRANEHSNSVGNLLLHLRGNVMMWIVAGLGRRDFERNRPAEFAQREPLPVEPLLTQLADAVTQADGVIAGLSEGDLAHRYEIQTYSVTGMEAVYHVVEHFAFH